MPTTHEFGPKGAFGDWEYHEEVATRFGVLGDHEPRRPPADADTERTENTTLIGSPTACNCSRPARWRRASRSRRRLRILAIDAGFKYKGVFLQAEYYQRWLDDFVADGPLPVDEIVRPRVLRAGGVLSRSRRSSSSTLTSRVFGDEDAASATARSTSAD